MQSLANEPFEMDLAKEVAVAEIQGRVAAEERKEQADRT
jgi:hypothetical protein